MDAASEWACIASDSDGLSVSEGELDEGLAGLARGEMDDAALVSELNCLAVADMSTVAEDSDDDSSSTSSRGSAASASNEAAAARRATRRRERRTNRAARRAPPARAAPAAAAAPRAAVPAPRTHGGRRYRAKASTNILAVQLGKLAEDATLATGEATFCKGCNAALSRVSHLVDKDGKVVQQGGLEIPAAAAGGDESKTESKTEATRSAATPAAAGAAESDRLAAAETPEMEAGEEEPEMDEGDLLWKCEFCNTRNIVSLDEEELPTTGTLDYVLEAAPASAAVEASADDSIVVFAIDVSGSMCVSTPVAGRMQLVGDKTESLMSLRAAGDNSNQYLPGQNRNVTYVSRIQSVTAAVAHQIKQLKEAHPKRKVALITFGADVTIFGDCTGAPRILAGTRLEDFDQLSEAGTSFPLTKAVGETAEALISKVQGLEEGGATALGPALLVAMHLAGNKRGSKVVLLTDGLANVGLGSLEDASNDAREASDTFYRRVGAIAATKGVVVDVVGIEGEGCDVETLSLAVEPSGGEITKVSAQDVTKNFSSILANPVVASDVAATLVLHKGLAFRNVEENDVPLADNKLLRNVGNVTADSDITFEYGVKSRAERAAAGLTSDLPYLPFQVQIRYTKLNGMKCIRLISQAKPMTRDRATANAHIKASVMASHATQQCAVMARRGSYSGARLNAMAYGKMLQRYSNDTEVAQNYMDQMMDLDDALGSELRQEQADGLTMRENIGGGGKFDEEEATSSATRSKARKARRWGNDKLSKAIHKAKKATTSSMSSAPRRSAAAAPAAAAAEAPAPATSLRARFTGLFK